MIILRTFRVFSNSRRQNPEEARVVVKLACLYQSKAMSFRIITPYDAQRSLIENSLKGENLQWEDKVFNVDSFQGSFPRMPWPCRCRS